MVGFFVQMLQALLRSLNAGLQLFQGRGACALVDCKRWVAHQQQLLAPQLISSTVSSFGLCSLLRFLPRAFFGAGQRFQNPPHGAAGAQLTLHAVAAFGNRAIRRQ